MPDQRSDLLRERSSDAHDGHTIVVPYCRTCPDPWWWPTKNLILNACPACGKGDRMTWRLAAARRLIEARDEC